jgi:subfamily B ATP-binding cassette protein MsbA
MARDISKTAAPPQASVYNLMRRLVKNYLFRYTGYLVLALLCMIAAAAMTAMIAKLMQPILDSALNGQDKSMILPVATMVLVTFIVRGFATYGHTVLLNKIGQSIIGDIQKDLFSHFMVLDLSFFHVNPSGQLISRVINDVNVVRLALTETLTGLGKNFMTLIFLIGVMIYQDWQLAIVALCILPVAVLSVSYIGRKIRRISINIQSETGSLSDRLSQIFQGIRQVKAYSMESHEKTRAGKAIDKVRKLNMKSVRIGNALTPLNECLVGLVIFGIILYGGHQVADGQMTTGKLASFLAAFTLAYEPVKRMAKANNTVQAGLGAAERVFEMMDLQPSIKNNPGAKKFIPQRPDVVFSDVEFHYEAAHIKALNGISFTAQAGKMTALVGPSGAGKSTIINLIPRFYDVESGQVLIEHQDVRDLTLESLRDNIALVSQDITIFDDTIYSNILYGRPGASKDEIYEAAKAAAAHDFILALPNGYETRVGEDGVKLSGGQRQRVSIARAILRNAPVLLLDEATSALDNESEKAVQNALAELQKGRTTIVIAHRLSTVQAADQIIVLDQGKIVEQGRHEALMEQDGLYAKMYRAGLKE